MRIHAMMCFVIVLALMTVGIASALSPPIVYVSANNDGDYNCDGKNDHVQIQKALDYVRTNGAYTTVHLNGGHTYVVDGQMSIGGGTTLTGDSDAIVKLGDEARWDDYTPVFKEYNSTSDNITIHGFEYDGNHDNQSVDIGYHYYTAFELTNVDNVLIYDMYIHDTSNNAITVTETAYGFIDTAHVIRDN